MKDKNQNQIEDKYTKSALIQYLFLQPVGSARCVIAAVADGSYSARLPAHNKVITTKGFSKSEYGTKAYSSAIRWVVDMGCEIWGEKKFIRYMYHEMKYIKCEFETSAPSKHKYRFHYGITNLKNGSYYASYKTPEGRYNSKTFRYSTWGDLAFDEAIYWLECNGIQDWGASRWNLIKSGKLQWVTSKNAGVSVNIRKSRNISSDGIVTEYLSWCVSWRETPNKPERSRFFSPKRFGDLESAGVAANFFAAKKRAERTCSTLNLPEELVTKWSLGKK